MATQTLDQWLESHREEISAAYLARRKAARDARSDESIRANVDNAVNLLAKSMRGDADWAHLMEMAARKVLETAQAAPSTTAEFMHHLYQILLELLRREQPEQMVEWIGIAGNYVLQASSMVAKVLEAHLEDLVNQRTAELQASQDLTNNIINSLPGIFYMLDEQGHFVRWNDLFVQVTGYPAEEIAQMLATALFSSEEIPQVQRAILEVFQSGASLVEATLVSKNGTQTPYYFTGVRTIMDGKPYLVGVGIDVSERKKAEEERERLQQQVIEAQQRAIQELSTPIIPIMDRIIVLPLIGTVDSMRARDVTRALLRGISEYRAKIVIIDITGVPLVDTGVAAHLDKAIQAARLKGARAIVTGVSDAVAETIVDLGIDWGEVETLRDLQTGLLSALQSLDIRLVR